MDWSISHGKHGCGFLDALLDQKWGQVHCCFIVLNFLFLMILRIGSFLNIFINSFRISCNIFWPYSPLQLIILTSPGTGLPSYSHNTMFFFCYIITYQLHIVYILGIRLSTAVWTPWVLPYMSAVSKTSPFNRKQAPSPVTTSTTASIVLVFVFVFLLFA